MRYVTEDFHLQQVLFYHRFGFNRPCVDISQFKHLLAKLDFDCIVYHLVLTYILKGKSEPVIPRIKRLLEVLTFYSFTLYYIKEIDITLSDFLSRIKVDKLHVVIPILFDLQEVLTENIIFTPDIYDKKQGFL